ncbi:MAG TPA: hypothetical protein PLO78_04820 [Candidatus Omnitrophota bacterium]|nr:hypothetical protein [Candidatus Omnitrophota bacterium]
MSEQKTPDPIIEKLNELDHDLGVLIFHFCSYQLAMTKLLAEKGIAHPAELEKFEVEAKREVRQRRDNAIFKRMVKDFMPKDTETK